MDRYFSDEALLSIKNGRSSIDDGFVDIVDKFLAFSYKNDRAREFAHNGFCRRFGDIKRAIEIVFEKLPPELSSIPDRNSVIDSTIAIQSLVMNVFGCLDNLAWIWVLERPVKAPDGSDLNPLKLGLGPKCREVRLSFSMEFISYLDSKQRWIDAHLKGFRDSLAHRVPLYIPPYIVSPEAAGRDQEIDQEKIAALLRGDLERHEEIENEQRLLRFWRPWMMHSSFERSPQVVFHAQIIADYKTVEEFGRKMLDELDSSRLQT